MSNKDQRYMRTSFDVHSVDDGYYALAAGIINQAILDYKYLRFMNNKDSMMNLFERRMEWEDAKEFLFTDRIYEFLDTFAIRGTINVKKIRKFAKGA